MARPARQRLKNKLDALVTAKSTQIVFKALPLQEQRDVLTECIELLDSRGICYSKLAERLGCAYSTIWRIRRQKCKKVSRELEEKIVQIAEKYRV